MYRTRGGSSLAEFARRAAAGECNVLHGGPHLAYFDAHTQGPWDWRGNAFPRL